jgi:transcriptional regulator with XRE-family HTH domain
MDFHGQCAHGFLEIALDLTHMQYLFYTSYQMSRLKTISRPPGTAEINVARRLAALRAESGLTLRDVAQRCGLSDAYLNRVERQKTPINIANLEKVAAVFGVPLSNFFESNTSQEPLVITRAGEGKTARFRGRKGFRAELLAERKKGKLMEPILVDLSSARATVPLQSHPGQEFNYVVEGRCVFHFGKEHIELSAGDSIYFDATVPHVCRALGKGPARILAVVSSANYPLHGNISVLLDDA